MPVIEEWITQEEKQLVDQLRKLVWNELPQHELKKSKNDQDAYLLRWLRARELNLEKAQNMLITNLAWRSENNVDQVLNTEPDPYFKRTYRYDFAGADSGGRPVLIIPFSEWDFRLMLTAKKEDGFGLYVRYMMEDWVNKISEYNDRKEPGQPPITQLHMICDLSEYAYGQIFSIGAMKKWLSFVAAYEAYYPEIFYRANAINCPRIFNVFMNMLKGVIAPRTLNKVVCYPTMADWVRDIDTQMDPAILPAQFGGTCAYNPFDTPILCNENGK